MKHRTGKIARLPREIRQELNERLREGDNGQILVAWLNSLPEVQAILAAQFAGKPIREQNLSEWRKGGYRDWEQRERAIEVAVSVGKAEAQGGEKSGGATLADALSLWLMREYAVATREIAESGEAEKWVLLKAMCADLARLQRLDQQAAKLRLGWQALAWEKEQEAKRRAERAEERELRYGSGRKTRTPEQQEEHGRVWRAVLKKTTEKDKWHYYQKWRAAESGKEQAAAGAAAAADAAEPGSASAGASAPPEIRPIGPMGPIGPIGPASSLKVNDPAKSRQS